VINKETKNIDMKVKYNRVSTLQQTGDRFTLDQQNYDLVLLDRVTRNVAIKEREKGKELIKLLEDCIVS